MTKRHIIIATRESPLALEQARWVQERLKTLHPHLSVELLGITTRADKLLETSLRQIGGKGLFVKELEEALLDGRADIAVHSMKDMPMELPEGLSLPVICEREDPRDAFISNQFHTYQTLPQQARVGTASLRRETQLKHLRSDLIVETLRGNINTRLKRLDEGLFDAIILAGAGLHRMHLSNRIKQYFSTEQMLPAAGQGALGIESRAEDTAVLNLIAPLNDARTHTCVIAERAVCRRLGGGCQVPIAAYAEYHQHQLVVHARVTSANGIRVIHSRLEGDPLHAEKMGVRVADELIQQGVETLLREFHGR